jgi:hypothetical protein
MAIDLQSTISESCFYALALDIIFSIIKNTEDYSMLDLLIFSKNYKK